MSSPAWQSRSRLVDEIEDHLREAIYSGELAPGTRLRQEQLAERLHVSRTPLREALRVLESDGLLTLGQGNAVNVVAVDGERFLDASAVREVIDGLAARIVAERQPAGLSKTLRTLLTEQRRALRPWNGPAFRKADASFHESIVRATDNPYIVSQVGLIRLMTQLFQTPRNFRREHAQQVVAEHVAIFNAIAAGDAVAAESSAREHIRRAAVRWSDPEEEKPPAIDR